MSIKHSLLLSPKRWSLSSLFETHYAQFHHNLCRGPKKRFGINGIARGDAKYYVLQGASPKHVRGPFPSHLE